MARSQDSIFIIAKEKIDYKVSDAGSVRYALDACASSFVIALISVK